MNTALDYLQLSTSCIAYFKSAKLRNLWALSCFVGHDKMLVLVFKAIGSLRTPAAELAYTNFQ